VSVPYRKSGRSHTDVPDRDEGPRPDPAALLADYEQRVAAFLIDVGIPAGVLVAVLSAALITGDGVVIGVVHGLAAVVAVIFTVWNCGWCQGRSGQSIGKRMLGTRLVGVASGGPVGFGRALGRHVAHVIDVLPLAVGYLWPLWDERRQTFADKVCSTLVVRADV
jgi:uncharacterized RDD family membrane protein YckC